MAGAVGKMGPSRRSAAKGFFALFYDWSVTCSSTAPKRHLHSHCRRPLTPKHLTCSQVRRHTNPAKPQSNNDSTEPALSTHLRTLMRTIPHPVVVATSTSPSADKGSPPKYRGMTLSSFTTLTLTPDPIVTFNIRKPSSTLDAIRESKTFFLHILSATRSGARVADAFTKGNGTASSKDVFRSKDFVVLRRGRDGGEPPLLAAGGIVRVLRCDILTPEEQQGGGLIEVGDHVLVLGKVTGILVPPGKEDGEEVEMGLGYVDRQYRQLGDVLELEDPKEP